MTIFAFIVVAVAVGGLVVVIVHHSSTNGEIMKNNFRKYETKSEKLSLTLKIQAPAKTEQEAAWQSSQVLSMLERLQIKQKYTLEMKKT